MGIFSKNFNQSIVSHTLVSVGIRILFVISLVTTISYFHIFSNMESTKLSEIQSFTQERAARESQVFTLAEDNHKLLKKAILDAYHPANASQKQTFFDEQLVVQEDGGIRVNPEIFNADDGAGVWVAKNVDITDELKYRVGLLHQLVSDYGKSWRNRFINTYAFGIENFAAIYWPSIADFTYRLEADFDIRLEEYFAISIEENNPQKKTVWTGVYRDKQADIWMVSIETPIYYQQQHIATIGNDMSLDELFKRTLNQAPQGGYNLIFRQDGRLIAHQKYVQQLKEFDGNFIINQNGDDDLKSIYQTVINADDKQQMIELPSLRAYLMVSKLDGPGWYYVSVIPKSVVTSVASNTAIIVFISGFIALVIELLVLFVVMKQKITRPLSHLNQATLALTQGLKAEHIDETRPDELGRLAQAFNLMNQNLIKRDKQLANANLVLEQQLQQIQLSQDSLTNAQAIARLGSWQYDTTTRKLTVSKQLILLLQLENLPQDELNLTFLFDCLSNSGLDEITAVYQCFITEEKAFNFVHKLNDVNKPQGIQYVHSTGQASEDGRVLSGTVQDITSQYKAEQAKIESQRLFNNVFENSTISMAVVSLDGQIQQANSTMCQTFGYTQDEICQLNYIDLLPLDERSGGDGELEIIQHVKSASYDTERVLVCKDGTELYCYINVFVQKNAHGLSDYIFIQCIDISLRKQAEVKLNQLAFHDPLTKLANRTLFIEFLTKAIKQYHRNHKYNFALLFLDLDGFKLVNDSLGHLEGDKLLVDFSERLNRIIRNSDTLARFGGDEFCVLMEYINDDQQAIDLAQRINIALSEPFILKKESVITNASIGIVLANENLMEAQDYLRDADSAMYHAKQNGRGCYAVFNADMHKVAKAQLRLRNELSQALDDKHLVAFFQPIINAQNGQIAGFEALVRWFHPTEGLIEPDAFLRMAEDIGRIAEIDYFVIDKAIEQIVEWRISFNRDDLSISCNASSELLSTYHVVDKINNILEKHAFPAHCLNIEITESVLINDPEVTLKILHQLDGLGINIHLDDFGTGYSSLSYLHRFPIHNIKIDRSFISRLMDNEKDQAIVESIVLLANRLGIGVTAEGVETVSQYEALQQIGVARTQGYYHGKPMAQDAALALLSAETSLVQDEQ